MNTEFESGTEFEQQLRDGMERFTGGAGQPRGLAVKAFKQRQHRRATARGVTVVGAVTALAGGAVAAGVTGAFSSHAGGQPGTGQQYQTTSYTIRRVESALAASGRDNVLGYTRRLYPAGSTLEPVGPSLLLSTLGSGTSPWSVGYSQSWMYHGALKVASFTASGQRVFSVTMTQGAHGTPTTTVVIYRNHTWWTATGQTAARVSGGTVNCGPAIQLKGGPGNGWPALIRQRLACGEFRVVGRQRVDGIDAIKITGDKGSDTLWVNPAGYLPIRIYLTLGGQRTEADFRWLAPTPADLAKLHLRVPAGFKQVPPPA